MVSPLEISIALHYHCRVDDYGRHNGDNNFDAPAVVDTLARFVEAGLLTVDQDGIPSYRATPGLAVWVDAICSVPLPVQQWIIPKCDG